MKTNVSDDEDMVVVGEIVGVEDVKGALLIVTAVETRTTADHSTG